MLSIPRLVARHPESPGGFVQKSIGNRLLEGRPASSNLAERAGKVEAGQRPRCFLARLADAVLPRLTVGVVGVAKGRHGLVEGGGPGDPDRQIASAAWTEDIWPMPVRR